MKVKHPVQPIIFDEHGTARFKENKLVRMLLNVSQSKGYGLNELAITTRMAPEFKDDWNQFAQLIGYSVSGFGDLSYTNKKTVAEADAIVEKMLKAKRKKK